MNPREQPLPNDENGKCMAFVIAGEEAFALSEHVLWPYSNKNLSIQQRIYNYRLTRAHRMVERAFCILANKWRIFHRPLHVTPQFCDSKAQACCILHNFVHLNNGFQLENTLFESNLESILATGTRGNTKGEYVTDYFAKYFTSPHGAVPWQYRKVWFGIWHTLKKYIPAPPTTTK